MNGGKESRTAGWSWLLTVGLCAILVSVVLMCIAYVKTLKETVEEENERYLSEISQHVAALVNYKVEANLQTLAVCAENWSWKGDLDMEYRRLDTIVSQYHFVRVGVVDMTGKAVTTDGLEIDMSGQQIVWDVLRHGTTRISQPQYSSVDGRYVIRYVVPILENSQVVGALYAAADAEQVQSLLSVESFGGEGYSLVVNSKGDYLLRAKNKNTIQGYDNFFTMLESVGRVRRGNTIEDMRADLQAGRSGSMKWDTNGRDRRSMTYVKLDIEDWYLLSVVPERVAGARSQILIRQSIAINTVIVVLFLLLIVLILWQNKKSRRTLEWIALVDGVTGGMNRTCFEFRAGEEIRKAPAGSYSLVALDILGFKLINDTFGSEEGNRTLWYIHRVLQKHLGDGEIAGRISADLFSVLLKHRSQEEIQSWLEDLARDINSFNDHMEKKFFLPVSAGVYEIDESGLDMITIQDRANVARKRGRLEEKEGSLSACAFYSEVERMRMLRAKEIDNRKEQALTNREFLVYLQPKVDLNTGRVGGAEALVRWKDPERGLVPPDDFIPAFERNGFITKVDLYVFAEVCRMLRKWLDQGREPVPISVNLSRVHLRNPNFLEEYQAVRDRYDIPPGLLEFEITETVAADHLDELIRVVRRLHELGYSCALDDFGSGSSSLNTLKDVPVDVLKLDRAFFSGAGVEDERGRSVVRSAVALARKLHMRTVSEGVENMAQVEILRKDHCDMVQGYVFSRPMPVDEFEHLAFCTKEAPFRVAEKR